MSESTSESTVKAIGPAMEALLVGRLVAAGYASERATTVVAHINNLYEAVDAKETPVKGDRSEIDSEMLFAALEKHEQAGFGALLWGAGVRNYGEAGSGKDFRKLIYNVVRSQFWASNDGTRVMVEGATTPKRAGKNAWAKPSAFTGETVSTALTALVRRVTAIAPDVALPDRLLDSMSKLSADIADINSGETSARIAAALESVEAKRLAASPTAQAANVWQKLQMVASMYDAMPATAQVVMLSGARSEISAEQRADADFCETLRICSKHNPFVELVLAAEIVAAQ